jgi:hypothetical protein
MKSVRVGPNGEAITVVRLSGKKKKKKKKRGGSEPVDGKYSFSPIGRQSEIVRGVDKAAHRTTAAVAEAVRTVRSGRDKAARNKKDGALTDQDSIIKAIARGVRIASWAPRDIYKAATEKDNPARKLLARIFLPVYK